jgi:hypothetical protein
MITPWFKTNSVDKYLKDKIIHELITVSFPTVKRKEICKINIYPSPKPIMLYENGNQTFYVRVGNSTRPYNLIEFLEYTKRRFPGMYTAE